MGSKMITSVELENYRGFSRFQLKNLARVNLLVGKNNCGKTSLLEAVQLLASHGDHRVLSETAWRRGEVVFFEEAKQGRQAVHVLSHFFHGHRFKSGTHLAVRASGGLGSLTIRVEGPVPVGHLTVEEQRLILEQRVMGDVGVVVPLHLELTGHDSAQKLVLFTTPDGIVVRPPFYPSWNVGSNRPFTGVPVQLVTPDSLGLRSMNEMWNKAITDRRESEVLEALQILDPNLANIFFLGGDIPARSRGTAGILIEFRDSRCREPLASHGDGMRRMLALALALIQAESGVLLVDEIDTGLHYSVMGQMWRLVTEAARRADVQVFATTHSQDCVRGLAWLCENHPELRGEVSLQKIHSDLEESVDLDAEGIMLAVDQGMEVR
jgi:hypothetical protein